MSTWQDRKPGSFANALCFVGSSIKYNILKGTLIENKGKKVSETLDMPEI